MSTRALRVMLAVGVLLMIGAVVGGVALVASPRRAAPTTSTTSTTVATTVGAEATGVPDATSIERASAPATSDGRAADGAPSTDAIDTAGSAPASSGPVSTDPAGTVTGDAIDCTTVVALADAVALSGGIDFSLGWPELQQALVDAGDSAAASYRAVVAVAPPSVDRDLDLLADYNTGLGRAAVAAASVTEFQATVAGPDDALLAATRNVDQFMRDSCSIGLTAD